MRGGSVCRAVLPQRSNLMSSHYVITISRQFASLGRTIAKEMSKRLNIDFMDRDIVAETAKRMGLTIQSVSDHDETVEPGNFFMRHAYLFHMDVYDINREIYEVQKSVIRDFAAKKSCIIVGRCADAVLADMDNVLNIFVYAPFEKRYQNCINELMMDPKTAAETIHRVDQARDEYRRAFEPEAAESELTHRHVMIDSSKFSISDCADILCMCAQRSLKMD